MAHMLRLPVASTKDGTDKRESISAREPLGVGLRPPREFQATIRPFFAHGPPGPLVSSCGCGLCVRMSLFSTSGYGEVLCSAALGLRYRQYKLTICCIESQIHMHGDIGTPCGTLSISRHFYASTWPNTGWRLEVYIWAEFFEVVSRGVMIPRSHMNRISPNFFAALCTRSICFLQLSCGPWCSKKATTGCSGMMVILYVCLLAIVLAVCFCRVNSTSMLTL